MIDEELQKLKQNALEAIDAYRYALERSGQDGDQ